MTSKTKPTLYESQREISALRKQLAERDAEMRRLRDSRVVPVVDIDNDALHRECRAKFAEREADHRVALATKDLELAAVQAREVKLRAALVAQGVFNDERVGAAGREAGWCIGRCVVSRHSADCEQARAALALPADSTALREACERVALVAYEAGALDSERRDPATHTKVLREQKMPGIVARVLGGAAK